MCLRCLRGCTCLEGAPRDPQEREKQTVAVGRIERGCGGTFTVMLLHFTVIYKLFIMLYIRM